MKKFRWIPGRQGTPYRKMLLAYLAVPSTPTKKAFLLGGDVWLIDYPPGTSIPAHVDPLDVDGRHFRLNIILRTGGSRYKGRALWRLGERIVFFRPDVMRHSVPVCSRRRFVLSVGWALRPEKL